MTQYDDDIAKEASKWVSRINSGDFNSEDESALRRWLDASEMNRQEYRAQVQLWQDLGAFESMLAPAQAENAEGAGNVSQPGSETGKLVDLPIGKAWRRLSVAASGLVAATLFAGFLIFSGDGSSVSGPQRYMTQKGHQTEALLADNTRILMNTDSNLVVEYKNEQRHVALEHGEAFFDVASDPSRPFVVETAWGSVKVLGTQFNVFSSADGLRVDVLEGRVEIDPRDDLVENASDMLLTANESLTVESRPSEQAILARETIEDVAPWRDGTLTFINQPLSEVIDEINRYSRREIVIMSPELFSSPVSGSFNIGDVTAFLEGLEAIMPLQTLRREGSILIELVES